MPAGGSPHAYKVASSSGLLATQGVGYPCPLNPQPEGGLCNPRYRRDTAGGMPHIPPWQQPPPPPLQRATPHTRQVLPLEEPVPGLEGLALHPHTTLHARPLRSSLRLARGAR